MIQLFVKYGLPALIFLRVIPSFAQEPVCSLMDRETFHTRMAQLMTLEDEKNNLRIVAIGKTFLGLPYVAKTLEVGEKESLIINFQGMDCTTFVENVLAFQLVLQAENKDLKTYAAALEKIRYRDGHLEGYGSRLHYFSEWIANNEQKGILRDITAEIGGETRKKKIDFMSRNRNLYPFLESPENYELILESEATLNNQPLCILPAELVAEKEILIASGDIIALTTAIEGLDITHTGIAIREADGRIHLLHASSSGQVEISKLPLADYLRKISKNTGIMVARPTTVP